MDHLTDSIAELRQGRKDRYLLGRYVSVALGLQDGLCKHFVMIDALSMEF